MNEKVNVLSVLDETIRHTELTIPTPLAQHGESFEHPVRHAGRLYDLKQARAAMAEVVSALRSVVAWHGARGGPGDELLPEEQQRPSIALAMRALSRIQSD